MKSIRRGAVFAGYPSIDRRTAEKARRNFQKPAIQRFGGSVAVRTEVAIQDADRGQEEVVTPEAAADMEARVVSEVPYAGDEAQTMVEIRRPDMTHPETRANLPA